MRTSIRASVLAVVAAGLLPASALAAGATTFTFTGTEQSYTVPAGVTSVSVVATGAHGGRGVDSSAVGGSGGPGSVVAGELAVTPGETLYVEVGGNGNDGSFGGAGGFNGGGAGANGGGGGGASDVRTCSGGAASCPAAVIDSLHSRILVAAGGGGGGSAYGAVSGGDGGAGSVVNGGDGASGTSQFKSGGGGGGATLSGGGSGGPAPNEAFCGDTPQPGADGGLGTGGASGNDTNTQLSGGGGGGGYWGGGGGAASCFGAAIPQPAEGGGGGAGSSYGPTGFSSGPSSAPAASVRIAPLAPPAVHASTSTLTFSGQPQGTSSAAQSITLTNTGPGRLMVTGLDFTGTHPGDYYLSASSCSAPVMSGGSCQVSVRFAPLATGTRSANLRISSNDPAGPTLVAITGVGTAAPQGPTGPAGRRGAAGKVELVSCRTVTRTVTKVIKHKRRREKITQQKCSARLVDSPVKIRTSAADTTAVISRGGVVYARGYRSSAGRLVLINVRRRLLRGRYTLTLRTRHGRHTATRRTTITLS